MVAAPDGDLAAYRASLDVLEAAVVEFDVREILPGHGPRVNDPLQRLRWYRRHRLERLEQGRDAVADGALTPAEW